MALPPGSWSWVLRCWGYLPGCLWPITDSGSCLVVHPSLSQDGFQQGGFWEVGRQDTWCLLWTVPEFFQSVVACQFHIPSQVFLLLRILVQVATVFPGQGGWFQSVFPLTYPQKKNRTLLTRASLVPKAALRDK